MKWAFDQIAKNTYRVPDIRRMAIAKALKCSGAKLHIIILNIVSILAF